MGKMKANALVGAALNWAVASVLGKKLVFFDEYFTRNGLASGSSQGRIDSMLEFQPLRGQWCYLNSLGGCVAIPDYGGDWKVGGPLIDAYDIDLYRVSTTTCQAECKGVLSTGPTRLIAAMRSLVRSHMGAEIEVPEDLCE